MESLSNGKLAIGCPKTIREGIITANMEAVCKAKAESIRTPCQKCFPLNFKPKLTSSRLNTET